MKEKEASTSNLICMALACTLGHVMLDVENLDRSLDFYEGVLGLSVQYSEELDGSRIAYVRGDTTEMMLIEHDEPLLTPSAYRGGIVLGFRSQSLFAVLSNARQAECEILREPDLTSSGPQSILLADPDGYAILVVSEIRMIDTQ